MKTPTNLNELYRDSCFSLLAYGVVANLYFHGKMNAFRKIYVRNCWDGYTIALITPTTRSDILKISKYA